MPGQNVNQGNAISPRPFAETLLWLAWGLWLLAQTMPSVKVILFQPTVVYGLACTLFGIHYWPANAVMLVGPAITSRLKFSRFLYWLAIVNGVVLTVAGCYPLVICLWGNRSVIYAGFVVWMASMALMAIGCFLEARAIAQALAITSSLRLTRFVFWSAMANGVFLILACARGLGMWLD